LLGVAITVTVILAIAKKYSPERKHLLLCTSLCLFMSLISVCVSFLHFDVTYQKREEMDGGSYNIDAVISSVRSQNNFASNYVIDVHNVNNSSDSHRALLVCEYAAALRVGDRITVNAHASLPEDSLGKYNEKTSLHSDNIFIIYTSENEDAIDVVEYESDSLTPEGINYALSSILTQSIDSEEGNLASALLLGNKNLLSDTVQRDFRRAGASHILALSGLHMSIIMGLAMLIMKRLTRKRWLIALTLSVFAIFYLLAIEPNFARSGLIKLKNGTANGSFTTTRFTNEAQCFALFNFEGNTVNRL
jgi:competence protein ComEC